MESFVLFTGAADPRATSDRIARGLRAAIPRAGAELAEQRWSIDEVRGGVVCMRPASDELRSLISVRETAHCFVAVYGKVAGRAEAAEAIAERIAQGSEQGLRAEHLARVRELDGSFAAILIDRHARTLHAFTDLIGCRALSWHEQDGMLVMSPHAISVLTAGGVPVRWDLCSVASATCVDWSVGRRPFLAELRTQKPYELVRWQAPHASGTPATQIVRSSPIAFDERIHRFDLPGLAAHGDAMVDAMTHAMRLHVAGEDSIALSLTAGLDSRATLGLLHAAGAQKRVRAQTNGLEGSADVEGARRLAAICGIPHVRNDPARPSSADFAANAHLSAFLSNGDANAKQCLTRLPPIKHIGSVGGAGGEIYIGFYYPPFLPFGHVPDDPSAIAETFMVRLRKARWSALSAWGSALQLDAQQRLEDELRLFQSFGARGSDLADLLYLWERYGHWGAIGYRRPWSHGFTPFATANAVRGLFRYPRAAGKHCDVHVRIIRRHLPLAAYLMPVNGSAFLPLRGRGEAAYLVRQAQQALGMVQKKVKTKLRTRESEAGVEQVWAGMFAGELYDFVHALLTDARSLSIATFGSQAVARLLERHRRERSQLQPLGALVMAEQFRVSAEAIAALV